MKHNIWCRAETMDTACSIFALHHIIILLAFASLKMGIRCAYEIKAG